MADLGRWMTSDDCESTAGGGAGLCARDFILPTPDRGGGEGTLNVDSSLSGDELACFLTVPPGA